MARPPKKKTKILAEAQELGVLKARLKMFKNEPSSVMIKRWIENMANKIDPMELVATIGATYIVKQGIEWSEILAAQASKNIFDVINLILPFTHGKDANIPSETLKKALLDSLDTPQVEIIQWFLSFCVGYLVVHNFASIIESGTSILSIGKTLLGVVK